VQRIIDFVLELDKLKRIPLSSRKTERGELHGRLRGTATFSSKMSGRE
jgi:hypothetical protein